MLQLRTVSLNKKKLKAKKCKFSNIKTNLIRVFLTIRNFLLNKTRFKFLMFYSQKFNFCPLISLTSLHLVAVSIFE